METKLMANQQSMSTSYQKAAGSCREIFINKTRDYGTSWRVLRPISIIDQLYIKARRIRTIQEKKQQRVADDISGEFMGIVNYAVIGLIQLQLKEEETEELSVEEVLPLYDEQLKIARELMENKNHDYGEAWRDMSQEGLTDLILMKLHRVKQILSNDGRTIASEGIDANYLDMINYALFALVLIGEMKESR